MTDNTTIRLSAKISKETHDKIREKYPTREALSFQSLVDTLLQQWIDADMPPVEEMSISQPNADAATAAKLLAWYKSGDGGPVERGFRDIVRDLINDKL